MATNLALNDKLIQQAVAVGSHKTKKDAVTAALKEYVKSRQRLGILALAGKVEYWDDYNHKVTRRGKRP
jgi:Arc/MetJ family transcription regulator